MARLQVQEEQVVQRACLEAVAWAVEPLEEEEAYWATSSLVEGCWGEGCWAAVVTSTARAQR
jgi:hypothetical protein